MKKIIAIGLGFTLLTLGASAQRDESNFKDKGGRKFEQRDIARADGFRDGGKGREFRGKDKNFRHDGKFSKAEKRKWNKMKHRHHGKKWNKRKHHRHSHGRR